MLSKKLKTIFWLATMFSFVALPLSCGIDTYIYRKIQEDWIEKNTPKVKLGMTYKDIESLLGYPTIIFFSSSEDLKRFKDVNVRKSSLEAFRFDSNTKVGEIEWLYFYYRDKLPDWPVYTFDSKTGKLIRISRKAYWE
jgi:hypothetical protein